MHLGQKSFRLVSCRSEKIASMKIIQLQPFKFKLIQEYFPNHKNKREYNMKSVHGVLRTANSVQGVLYTIEVLRIR